jgi:hypothetical protein
MLLICFVLTLSAAAAPFHSLTQWILAFCAAVAWLVFCLRLRKWNSP